VQVRFSWRLHQEFLHGSARHEMDLHGHDVERSASVGESQAALAAG
jgi:hypothetical protein